MFNFRKNKKDKTNSTTHHLQNQEEQLESLEQPNEQDDLQLEEVTIRNIKEPSKKSKLAKKPKEVKKKVENEKVNQLEFLTEKAINAVTKGSLDIQQSEFEFGSQTIMSSNHIKRVIQITRFPEFIMTGHLEKITKEVKELVPPSFRNQIGVNLIEHNIPMQLFMADKRVKGSERRLRSMLGVLKKKINEDMSLIESAKNIRTSRESVDGLMKQRMITERKLYSFEYINRCMNRGVKVMKSYIFIEVTAEDREILADCVRNLLVRLNSSGYIARDLMQLRDYSKEFSLASIKPSMKTKTPVVPMTTTTQISSMTNSYEQGLVRTPTADVYIGHEIDNNYPAYISYSESTDKWVELILAESGGGKSLMGATRSLFASMHKNGTYRQVARDYKGDEAWTNIARLVKGGKVISMNISNPSFINTFAITPNSKKYGMTQKEMFNLCSSQTANMLAVLCGAGESDINSQTRARIESVCIDIVKNAYRMNGILIEETKTYQKSNELDFRPIMWDAIKMVTADSKDYEEKHYDKNILSLIRNALQPYFSNTGEKNYLFNNSVDIEELMESPYITFNYGLKTGAGDKILTPSEKTYRTLQEMFFVTLYMGYNYANNKFTLYWIDDLQEQLNNTLGIRELSQIITVGRSINMKPIMITNIVSTLLHSSNEVVDSIKKNISVATIGKAKEDEAKMLLDYLGYNDLFYKSRDVFSSIGKMRYSFLLVQNTAGDYSACISKVMLPKHIINSNIFKTTTTEI